MTPERWQTIKALFDRVVELPAAARATALADACAGDADLRQHVEALLAANDGQHPLLDASLDDLTPLVAPGSGFAPGARVGPYRIVRQIGRGGMGVVYLAHDESLGRDVALKRLPLHLGRDATAQQRFIQEARAASALDHPHIATIYEIGEADDGTRYIAMGYYGGGTLKARLAGGPLPIPEALAVAEQLARGLAAAHRKGIVHRDVKPGNVLFDGEERVKIVDFGLAKVAGHDLTQTGATLGTVAFMAPEQARGEPVDHRADLWAVGVVLYEMLTGARPFGGDHPQSVLRNILEATPAPLAEHRADLPDGLAAVMERLLAKAPDDRYGDAGRLADDLHALAHGKAPAPPSPRRRYRTRAAALVLAAVLAAAAFFVARPSAGGTIEAIAVLPLADFSPDTSKAYLADGMTEALIAGLARIRALRVISRTSVMQYRNRPTPLPEIARALDVDAVVQGAVTSTEDRVRITVQLIDAATEQHLWSNSYERDLGDILALQAEVARAIAGEIEVQLTPQEAAQLATARTVNPAAHEAYLRGRLHFNKRTEEGLRAAVTWFDDALEHDPDNALAYAGLAEVYSLLSWYGGAAPQAVYPRAAAAARRALALDPNLAEAYAPLGQTQWQYAWDLEAAEAAFQRAIALNPNYATAHQWYGEMLAANGRPQAGLALLRRAQTLDPLSPVIAMDVGSIFFFSRRYDEAVAAYQALLSAEPDFAVAYTFLGMALEQQGRYEAALEAQQRAIELGGRAPLWLTLLARAYATTGRPDDARAVLEELESLSGRRFVSPMGLAIAYAGLGETDTALDWLDQAIEQHDPYMVYFKVHPQLDALRQHPRFVNLLQRLPADLPE